MPMSSSHTSLSRLPSGSPSRLLLRMLIVVVLFFGMYAPAVAGQIDPDGIKDAPRNEESEGTPEATEESPGLEGEGDYVSPQFDIEITWTDAWEIADLENPLVEFAVGGNFDAPITSDPEMGDVVFLMDTATESSVLNFAISGNDTGLDPVTMEQVLGQPEVLEDSLFVAPDSEILLLDSNDEAAAIMVRDANDTDHIIYLSVNFTPDNEFYVWTGIDIWQPEHYESVLTDFAEEVEISEVDPFAIEDVEGLIELAQSEPTEDDATPEADETPEDDATEEADETPEDATPGADADLPGLVAEGEYESPQHGTEITWTDAWILDERRDEPTGSDEDEGYDSVFLTDAATESTVLYMTVEELASSDPADILDRITREGYVENVFGVDPDSEILLQDSTEDAAAILLVDDTGDQPLVILMEVHALDEDGLVAFVDFRAYANDIDEDVLTAIEEDLEIGGRPGLTVFTVDEVLTELEGI